jgi:hypothetical protein
MPAYRERIYICPAEDGHPGWIGDFPVWWDRPAFFEQFGGRQIDTGHPIYVDYGLLLTAAEARSWDQHCRDRFDRDPRSRQPIILESMRSLEARLNTASWVIVESYEWESGLS